MSAPVTDHDWNVALGPVRRRKDGDILHAENDFISGAFVVTDDQSKIGELGVHGPRELFVEYVDAETAKLWDDK